MLRQVFSIAIMAICATNNAAIDVDSAGLPHILEYSNETAGYMEKSPIRTLFMVAADSNKPDYTDIIDGLKDASKTAGNRLLYVVVPPTETKAMKKYFGGINYSPAVFIVNRTTGAYARPFKEFTNAEKKDYSSTLREFVAEFSEQSAQTSKDVMQVTSESQFNDTISQYPLILVKFYAPWCGHCKKLAPHYQKAATILKEMVPPIPLASVDATSQTDLKTRFAVDSFPTIKTFRDGSFIENYDGGLSSSAIVSYVKRQVKPATTLISADAVVAFAKKTPAVLGVFATLNCSAAKHFANAAAASEHSFAVTTNAQAAAVFGVQAPAVLVFGAATGEKQVKLPQAACGSGVEINMKVEGALWPMVMEFRRTKLQQKRVQSHPVKTLLILAVDRSSLAYDEQLQALTAAARSNSKQVLHLWADARDHMLMARLRIKPADVPTAVVFNPFKGGTKGAKRRSGSALGEVTADALLDLEREFHTVQEKKQAPKDWEDLTTAAAVGAAPTFP